MAQARDDAGRASGHRHGGKPRRSSRRYFGKRVAVTADVEDIYTAKVFALDEDKLFSPGDARVIVSTDTASIMPYDMTTATTPDAVCNTVLKRFVHAVVVQFDRPGNLTLRVWGRRVHPGLPPGGEPVVLEHRLVVAP
jgi:hypothetical protein